MIGTGICDEEIALLLDLLRCPTVTPLEGGEPPAIAEAQRLYTIYAATLGMRVAFHASPSERELEDPLVPLTVRDAARRMGERYLECQPNLVLRLGPPRALTDTIAINTHIDTVGGGPKPRREDDRIWGRGAVDMKGPAVAVLAAIRQALAARPRLSERTTLLLHCVAGEEGGAMGVHGTRTVLDSGFAGCLTIFAEPTGGCFLDHCTASMTACIELSGEGSTDDEPAAAHNATILLGALAVHLARALDGPVSALGGKLCVAGLHTGERHDRVYGSGRLLLNLAYPSTTVGERLEVLVEQAFREGVAEFAREQRAVGVAARVARDAQRLCKLTWSKRGLPTLGNRDALWEQRLGAIGIPRLAEESEAFTCDAIWGGREGVHSIVFGPGHLVGNGAHTEREHIDLADLARYANRLARLVLAFDDRGCEARA